MQTAVCDSGGGPPQATTTIHRDSQQHGRFVDHQGKAAGSTPLSPSWLSPPHWVCCVHSHCKLCVMLTACDVAATARPRRRGNAKRVFQVSHRKNRRVPGAFSHPDFWPGWTRRSPSQRTLPGLGSVSTSCRSLQTATSLPFLNMCNIT